MKSKARDVSKSPSEFCFAAWREVDALEFKDASSRRRSLRNGERTYGGCVLLEQAKKKKKKKKKKKTFSKKGAHERGAFVPRSRRLHIVSATTNNVLFKVL